jgi:Nucleoside-diphosphate-sugar epimerases
VKIIVTGATGFVGRHAIAALLARGHEVVAVARNYEKFAAMPWKDMVTVIVRDIHADIGELEGLLSGVNILMHLAWPGLPNYKELFHVEETLPADYRFIKAMVEGGVKRVLVTGTCFEYGMQYGPLDESAESRPTNPYGLAKDSLRRFLEALERVHPFVLQWVRLFYMYGPGQNPNSLLAQLDRAIDAGEVIFNMSGGEQLRDYLPVEEVARRLSFLVEHPECRGIVNCCSGRPVSVRRLVEDHIAARKASIRLNLGFYPYTDYEPMAFWGNPGKLSNVVS